MVNISDSRSDVVHTDKGDGDFEITVDFCVVDGTMRRDGGQTFADRENDHCCKR